jgi:hypothetical protein
MIHMTLRDWFAGMALAEVPDPRTSADAPETARLAYAIADAMMLERTRPRARPTVAELEEMLREPDTKVEVLPDGSCRPGLSGYVPQDGLRGVAVADLRWPAIEVLDPVTNIKYMNVNRAAVAAGDVEHLGLPKLRPALTNGEWRDLVPEYRGMYSWSDGDVKWRLQPRYRKYWG